MIGCNIMESSFVIWLGTHKGNTLNVILTTKQKQQT